MKSKFLKITSIMMAILMMAASFAGCKSDKKDNVSDLSSAPISSEAQKTDINVSIMKGPTAIGMLKLMSEDKNNTADNNYKFQIFTDPTHVSPEIMKGNIDIAAVPTNMAATLYQKTNKGVSIIAVNTLGVLSILTNGVEITSVSDLKGKTIYASGQGSTNEYALNYILEKNGLKVGKDVKVEYKSAHDELATAVISGQADIAMLPQPFVTNVTMKNKDVKVALDLSEEWSKIPGNENSDLVMGCLIVRNELLKNNKAAVDAFLAEYSESTAYANNNISETALLSDEFGILPSAVVSKAIPSCNIVYITGDEMKQKVSAYLTTLYDANPASIGNVLPDDGFYYAK